MRARCRRDRRHTQPATSSSPSLIPTLIETIADFPGLLGLAIAWNAQQYEKAGACILCNASLLRRSVRNARFSLGIGRRHFLFFRGLIDFQLVEEVARRARDCAWAVALLDSFVIRSRTSSSNG